MQLMQQPNSPCHHGPVDFECGAARYPPKVSKKSPICGGPYRIPNPSHQFTSQKWWAIEKPSKCLISMNHHESMNIPLIINWPVIQPSQVVQNVVHQQRTYSPKPESTAPWNSPLGNKKDNAVACYICQCEGHLHVEHGRGINAIKHL